MERIDQLEIEFGVEGHRKERSSKELSTWSAARQR
jgi:hypothetical protein